MNAAIEFKKLDLDQARVDILIPALDECVRNMDVCMSRIYDHTMKQIQRDLPSGKTLLSVAQVDSIKSAIRLASETGDVAQGILAQLEMTRKAYRECRAAH